MPLGEIIEGRYCHWSVYNYDDAVQTIGGRRIATGRVTAGMSGLHADHRG